MSKFVKRSLSRVSIGSYIVDERGRSAVPVTDPAMCIRQNSLYDQGMGYLDKPGWPACAGDHAACFGRMGYIPLDSYILNPAFDSAMVQYLALFSYARDDTGRHYLSMREGVAHLVEKHRTLKGYRRLKAISEEIVSTNPWKVNDEVGGMWYRDGKDDFISISGRELRELLADATYRYSSDSTNVSLADIGIDVSVSRPEDFVRGDIPVLPNIMRAPQRDSSVTGNCVKGKHHPFTEQYARIVDAVRSRNTSAIRKEWMNLIKTGEGDNLKNAIFSDKKAFLRGHMFSKVGGQIARSVVAPNPRQRPDQVGIPRLLAKDVSYRVLVTEDNLADVSDMIREGRITHLLHTRTGEYIKIDEYSSLNLEPGRMLVLRELQDGDIVLANRQPTLHKNSILGFEVYLHDYDTIYIHPSATKSFGMDFDGDEANCIFPYTPMGMREVKELMFIEHNMASLASSSLLVGYHQDVNLASHMMTMTGTHVPIQLWDEMARISYETLWSSKYPTYEHWVQSFIDRVISVGIDIYSGRSLYSTLLPEDMEWTMDTMRITRGILVSGTLESKSTSGTSSSIGMVLYRTYGSKQTVSWLNASYRMLNLYLIQKGITLGFPHLLLSREQVGNIDAIKRSIGMRQDLQIDTDDISDPVLRARTENEVSQELSNVRETISVEVMNPTDPLIAQRIRGKVSSSIIMDKRAYTVYPTCTGPLCVSIDPMLDMPDGTVMVDNEVHIPAEDSTVDIDLYGGSITLIMRNKVYVWSMGIFPRIRVSLIEDGNITAIDRSYSTPNPLNIMIESGARGNATNAIQIAGIIGQQSYGGGRIPRMLDGGQVPTDDGSTTGRRSMPCYPFGSNTPVSRGFIPESYLEGMPVDRYMNAHVASRENLTSNTDLTPRTGYFERRVRTFTENLRISKVNGCNVVTNERGIIVMWDCLLDPSRIFSIDKNVTFVDIPFETRYMKPIHTDKRCIFIYIPYKANMSSYLSIDRRIKQLISLDTDIIAVCDPLIEAKHPDVYEYLRDMIDGIHVITLPRSVPQRQRESFFMSMTEYRSILVVPITSPVNVAQLREYLDSPLGEDVIASIDVSSPSIYGASYPVQKGSIIQPYTLYNMIVYGIDLTQRTMIVRPNEDAYRSSYPLIESLIMDGRHISSL